MSEEIKDFIEWLYKEDRWHLDNGEWVQTGYRSRTTEQLFEHFLKFYCAQYKVKKSV